MCDLIDLKSPEKKTLGPKLASPLIPAPTKSLNDEKSHNNSSEESSGLNFVKRNSLDNNPFDNALHKTAEYVRKQDDPFEVVLEKALKYNEQNVVVTPKAHSVQFKDDFTPKKTRYSDILKMNKTLDDSIIEIQLNASDAANSKMSQNADDSIIHDLNNTNLMAEGNDNDKVSAKFRLKNGRLVPKLCVEPSPADLSILNQSAMNDSLTDSGDSSEEFLIKSIVAQRISLCIQKGTDDANFLAVEELPKAQKLRRSFSQGDRLSPRKFRQHRSQSIVDSLKASMGNEGDASVCSTPSIFFDDKMNKAFLQTQCANNVSVISDLSNISAITRLTSVSSACNSTNSSSVFSNRTANCAFIESCGSNISGDLCLNKKIDERKSSINRIHSTGSIKSIIKNPLEDSSMKNDISDLLNKYSLLKVKSAEEIVADVPITRLPSIICGSGFVNFSDCKKPGDKLIDVDVFVPEMSSTNEQSQRGSVSEDSSDSVFIDSNTIGKSILSEAKRLAQTFEDLAGKTSCSSGSSMTDDLLNSRPHWNFDLLPVSDDEDLVNNLIELPNSPVKEKSPEVQNADDSVTNRNKSYASSEPKSEKSMLKELESEFIDPEKKIYASSLLMDLEKLVKSEGNPEAIQLLENLEKALNVKCKSNSELLASCFSEKNNLTKSPKRSENNLGTENIRNESNEKSCEDNIDVESSESLKQLSLSEKSLENNLNIQKEINKSDKSLVLVSEKLDNLSPEKSGELEIHDSCDKDHDDSIAAIKRQNHITDDQKMAVEILVGLGKLLSGENKDPISANLLKNLGMVLNLASSNSNNSVENCVQTDVRETKKIDTPVKKRVATPPRKSPALSTFSRSSSSRRSLESSTKSKSATEREMRRSISVTHTPTSTTPKISSNAISADKSKAHLKEVKKRFSSDPGMTNAAANKKKEIQGSIKQKYNKDISLKPVGISELARQEKPSSTVAETVKCKLRKKADSDGSSKRGPMKALLPLGNMQRRGSIGKRVSPLTGAVTPPKQAREPPSDFTVTTSTPFPTVHLSCPKKSPKTKPIASSTPDAVGPKNMRRSASILPSPGKNTFSCNISPVTSKIGEDNVENSSEDASQSSKTSKICTPSKSRSASQLPRLSPLPGQKISPKNSSRNKRRSEPLQSFLPRSMNAPKSPSVCVTDTSSSPHHNSNKIGLKVKPLNLISKLRRRSASVAEKENYA